MDASEKFFKDLEGVSDPEQKRKIIGRDFVEVLMLKQRDNRCKMAGAGNYLP